MAKGYQFFGISSALAHRSDQAQFCQTAAGPHTAQHLVMTYSTHITCALAVAALGFCGSGIAQNAHGHDARINEALLYALTEAPAQHQEPEPSYLLAPSNDPEAQAHAKTLPAVPQFAAPTHAAAPELNQLIQLATAHRLRGETVEAGEYYAQIIRQSDDAKHVFFFAEMARANGQSLLAEALQARYAQLRAGEPVAQLRPLQKPVRLAALFTHARESYGLAGVTVHVFDPAQLVEYIGSTDNNGLCVIDGLSNAAALTIRATSAGFAEAQQTLDLRAEQANEVPIIATRVYLQPLSSDTL